MNYLKQIVINFPGNDSQFFEYFFSFLGIIGNLPNTPDNTYPVISTNQSNNEILSVDFITSTKSFNLEVKNVTSKSWKSNYKYQYISLEDFYKRMNNKNIVNIDHLGVNLPWIAGQVHPGILNLRDELKSLCLYHLFPSSEPWDFIIPGFLDEITNNIDINYNIERKPKFEIVSFDDSSTPIFQIDVSTDLRYEQIKHLFPEAINLDDIKASWVYLKSNYYFDVCLVLNEKSSGWTNFFKDSRLV